MGFDAEVGTVGIGRGQGLASRGFRLLDSLGSVPGAAHSLSHAHTSRFIIAPLNSSPGSGVNEEGPDFSWDGDAGEAKGRRGVEAS